MAKWYECTCYLNIGFAGEDQESTFDVRDYGMTEEEWLLMGEDDQICWLDKNCDAEIEALIANSLDWGFKLPE